MATLTVRNLPDEVHDALRRRAAQHRRSMEAEAREVLRQAVETSVEEARHAAAVAAIQAMSQDLKAKTPEGWSLVDEFLAEKRLDSALEAGRITDAERHEWLDRLDRYEAWPADVEAFLAARPRSL